MIELTLAVSLMAVAGFSIYMARRAWRGYRQTRRATFPDENAIGDGCLAVALALVFAFGVCVVVIF